MALLLYSIDEAVDRKFIVTKSYSSQAKAGTLVHIMGAKENVDSLAVKYRVTNTGQDFSIKFDNLKQFCKWARSDNFIARHYENLDTKDILHYIKVTNRTFTSFCLPMIIVLLAVVWVLAAAVLKNVVIGVVLSVLAVLGTMIFYKVQKNNVVVKLYGKVSSNNWGIVLK